MFILFAPNTDTSLSWPLLALSTSIGLVDRGACTASGSMPEAWPAGGTQGSPNTVDVLSHDWRQAQLQGRTKGSGGAVAVLGHVAGLQPQGMDVVYRGQQAAPYRQVSSRFTTH